MEQFSRSYFEYNKQQLSLWHWSQIFIMRHKPSCFSNFSSSVFLSSDLASILDGKLLSSSCCLKFALKFEFFWPNMSRFQRKVASWRFLLCLFSNHYPLIFKSLYILWWPTGKVNPAQRQYSHFQLHLLCRYPTWTLDPSLGEIWTFPADLKWFLPGWRHFPDIYLLHQRMALGSWCVGARLISIWRFLVWMEVSGCGLQKHKGPFSKHSQTVLKCAGYCLNNSL